MPDTVTVPTAPALATIPNVELVQTGTWSISNGTFTWTTADLYSAVAALECPAVRRPVLKFGHDGNFGIGEPAVGYIANMAVADGGRTLVGDYTGMPGWLGDVIASAYPDRSIEGEFDYRCQMGHTHPFVVHAVALLGVEHPGIGSLASLQDVAQLYGVQAAANAPDQQGLRVAVLATSKETVVPNPQPRPVAASVTSQDVSRAFYASAIGADWDIWIEEMQVDPLQVIYCNDATGEHFRVPVVIGSGDGSDAVSFGEPVRVVNNWTDSPANKAAAGAEDGNVIRFASRAESRPGARPQATDTPPGVPATAAAGGTTEQEAPVADTELHSGLRQRLGIADDADEATILAAVDEALAERADPAAGSTPQVPDGMTLIETETLEQIRVAASAGQEARTEQLRTRREQLVSAAVEDGRIAPSRREHWLTQLEADPGSETVLASLAKGLVPVEAKGYEGTVNSSDDELYASLFPAEAKGA